MLSLPTLRMADAPEAGRELLLTVSTLMSMPALSLVGMYPMSFDVLYTPVIGLSSVITATLSRFPVIAMSLTAYVVLGPLLSVTVTGMSILCIRWSWPSPLHPHPASSWRGSSAYAAGTAANNKMASINAAIMVLFIRTFFPPSVIRARFEICLRQIERP